MRTDQWVPACALRIPLPVGQPGDDLHCTPDHALDLRQGRLNHCLHFGKRLGGLYPIIPDALAPFGHCMLHHAADTCVHIHGFVLHPVRAMGAVMVCDPLKPGQHILSAWARSQGDVLAALLFLYSASYSTSDKTGFMSINCWFSKTEHDNPFAANLFSSERRRYR
jgi:hypothetical protein